jgi:hypothetical protein
MNPYKNPATTLQLLALRHSENGFYFFLYTQKMAWLLSHPSYKHHFDHVMWRQMVLVGLYHHVHIFIHSLMILHASLLTIARTAACSRPCVAASYINDTQLMIIKIHSKGLRHRIRKFASSIMNDARWAQTQTTDIAVCDAFGLDWS